MAIQAEHCMNVELKIDLTARGDELRRFIENRVEFALGLYADWIEEVAVQAGTVVAPEADRDQGCRVQVRLTGQEPVIVESHEANLFIAIHRAIDQAGWKVACSVTSTPPPSAQTANRGRQRFDAPALGRAA